MYSFDPATQNIEHVGDLNEASGEKKARLFEVYGYPFLARKPK